MHPMWSALSVLIVAVVGASEARSQIKTLPWNTTPVTTMKEGLVDEIQYGQVKAGTSQWDGVKRVASITQTDKHSLPFNRADDPKWLVVELPPSTNHSEFEKIEYLTFWGYDYKADIHCHYDVIPTQLPNGQPTGVQRFSCDFHHVDIHGSEHDSPYIGFLDWDGNAWLAYIVPPSTFPGRPRFMVKKCRAPSCNG